MFTYPISYPLFAWLTILCLFGCYGSRAPNEPAAPETEQSAQKTEDAGTSLGGSDNSDGTGSESIDVDRDASPGRVPDGGVTDSNPFAGTIGGPISPPNPTDFEECARMNATLVDPNRQVDIIFAIETNAGMVDEVAGISAYFNSFFQRVTSSNVDPSIVLLAAEATDLSTDDYVCIDPPLGSGSCPEDSNPPKYFHVDQAIGQDDALNQLAETSNYRKYLRENVAKFFVVISDGDAIAPPYNSADAFIDFIQPNLDIPEDWFFSGLFCYSRCPHADAIGHVYDELVGRTDGVASDLCLLDPKSFFERLADRVIDRVSLGCVWQMITPPDGEDPLDIDLDEISVQFIDPRGIRIPIPRFLSEEECASNIAWYLNDEDEQPEIVLCPEACLKSEQGLFTELEIRFGCYPDWAI